MRNVVATPATRALARQKGVDLEALSAKLGRVAVASEDILGQSSASVFSTGSNYWDVDHARFGPISEDPLSRFAQAAARNLTASHATIPAVTHHDRADMTAVESLRVQFKSQAEARGTKLTALAFHIKALARTLEEFPRFNASLSSDMKTLILKNYVHIGIAVDTPMGLMVPVIRNADRMGLWAIADQIADLASRAQSQKVRSDEMGGASMSITNLGSIGGTAFTPIINPPEVAILGITRTEAVPVWNGETFIPIRMAPLDLSYDHRVINGADAARFVKRYADLVADPRRLLV